MGMIFKTPRALCEDDDLTSFRCGVTVVDEWLQHYAATARSRGTAVVYVCFADDMLAGYYALSAHSVCRKDVSGGWLKRNVPEQIPAVLLGMLGVDQRFKGMGLGRSLLKDAIERSLVVSSSIGAKALIVDPAHEPARSFYRHYGFREIGDSGRMYLPLKIATG